jgi:hypothetical protein
MSNGTKHQIDIMSEVRKVEWDKMLNGKNVESKKGNWDKMLNGKKCAQVNLKPPAG